MSLLGGISGPADLAGLSNATLTALAQEIRAFLIDKVCGAGGHLGPNLGVVELTIAAHRVFASPRDVLLFDTGHQAYVHKILTGRCAEFDSLRQASGLSVRRSDDALPRQQLLHVQSGRAHCRWYDRSGRHRIRCCSQDVSQFG